MSTSTQQAPRAQNAPMISRPHRFLTRMVLFLIVVVAITGLLHQGVSNAFMANPALNGLIVGVLVLGIVYIFRQVLLLRREIHWLDVYQRGQTSVVNLPEPRLLAPMARMLGERRGKLQLSATAMRSLLDGISTRLDETRELSRYLVGLLIFLGLLGTFWGLLQTIAAVAEVVGDLNVADGDVAAVFGNLQAGLEAPLSGMGTAFSSSLFGLAGSLVLGFLELQAGQAQNRFYMDLEDWLSGATRLSSGAVTSEGEQSVPAYLEALLEQTAENIEDLRRTVAQSEEGRRVANNNLTHLTEKLSALTDQMRTEQNLMVRLAENQVELKSILGRLADSASNGQFGVDDVTRQHVRNIEVYLSRLGDELSTGRTQTVQEIRNEIKVLTRTIAALAEDQDN